MAGKKSAKGGDPEVVPALTETAAAAGKNPEAAPAAVEDPAAFLAAADPQGKEAPEEEIAEESGGTEMPVAEAAAVPGSEPQGQDVVSGEVLEAGSRDIFSDEVLLEESQSEEGMQGSSKEEPAAGPEEIRVEKSRDDECQGTVEKKKLFKITCRNSVSEVIGGVMFVAGVGYTRDAYAASWFANKAGYRVDREG